MYYFAAYMPLWMNFIIHWSNVSAHFFLCSFSLFLHAWNKKSGWFSYTYLKTNPSSSISKILFHLVREYLYITEFTMFAFLWISLLNRHLFNGLIDDMIIKNCEILSRSGISPKSLIQVFLNPLRMEWSAACLYRFWTKLSLSFLNSWR